MIDDARRPEHMLIYTTVEGGEFHALGGFSPEEYIDLKRHGFFTLFEGDIFRTIRPTYARLVVCIDEIDFVLRERSHTRLPFDRIL